MTTNRLDYQTIAGELSSDVTFAQLIENLSLAIEDAQSLSNLASARNDQTRAKQWAAFAIKFQKLTAILTDIAKNKASSSTGYRQ